MFVTLAALAHLTMATGSFISWHAFNTHNLHPSRHPYPDSAHYVWSLIQKQEGNVETKLLFSSLGICLSVGHEPAVCPEGQ